MAMTAEAACADVHALLETLPTFGLPSEVAFSDGLYFFYEAGESSPHARRGRIVRVGNHSRSEGGLVRRLQQHYSGRKNGSAFRKLLGGALLRTEHLRDACLGPGPGRGHWERQGGRPCHRCAPVEARVSALLRESFSFRCVEIRNRDERNLFEESVIATLAQCQVCRPSGRWLGSQAYAGSVRTSGLWNSQFVDAQLLSKTKLARFAVLALASTGSMPR